MCSYTIDANTLYCKNINSYIFVDILSRFKLRFAAMVIVSKVRKSAVESSYFCHNSIFYLGKFLG